MADVEQTLHEIFHIGSAVDEYLCGEPAILVVAHGLYYLVLGVDLVEGLENLDARHLGIVGKVKDAGHNDVEVLGILGVVTDDEVTALIFEGQTVFFLLKFHAVLTQPIFVNFHVV